MSIAQTLERIVPQIARLEERQEKVESENKKLRTKNRDLVERHGRLLELLRRTLPKEDQADGDLEGLVVSLLAVVVRNQFELKNKTDSATGENDA